MLSLKRILVDLDLVNATMIIMHVVFALKVLPPVHPLAIFALEMGIRALIFQVSSQLFNIMEAACVTTLVCATEIQVVTSFHVLGHLIKAQSL